MRGTNVKGQLDIRELCCKFDDDGGGLKKDTCIVQHGSDLDATNCGYGQREQELLRLFSILEAERFIHVSRHV